MEDTVPSLQEVWVCIMMDRIFIYDFEVFAYDWLVVFKHVETGTGYVYHNDPEGVAEFIQGEHPLLCGWNNKHYDDFILRSVLLNAEPEQVKIINDLIIHEGLRGWEIPSLHERYIPLDTFDLKDDTQAGLSLKSVEAHLGMDIEESEVDFNLDRPLTPEELEQTIFYCRCDVDATERIFHLRKDYLNNKLYLGAICGLPPERALYMTNAKLTAAYLGATQPEQARTDERDYRWPEKLDRSLIPYPVRDYFHRLGDRSIPDEQVFSEKLTLDLGDCPVTIGYGGIHGAIPTYQEEVTETRTIRNQDVASYYPHLMVLMGYCSRNMADPKRYADTLETRVKAKRAGEKEKANALKLVLNTTYGAMLNRYNGLYDPLMGRSVCISGQLFLLELAEHLRRCCPSLRVIQLNTDGIMVSFDLTDEADYYAVCEEWQKRTGFELEEDRIRKIIQKDVNNYIEIPEEGEPKIKGGDLVRGISTAGAFNVNKNATVIARAVYEYFVHGTPVRETVEGTDDLHAFQLVAKASYKYTRVFQKVRGEEVPVQRCNRVYATDNLELGTLYKVHGETGQVSKVPSLPLHCLIDNNNKLTVHEIDKGWYTRQAEKVIDNFLGRKPPRKNTRKINRVKKEALTLLEGVNDGG